MLSLPKFDYVQPATLDEALGILDREPGASILAGGTDLLVNMRYGLVQPKIVLGIKELPELSTVSHEPDGSLRIGACAGLTEIAGSSLIAQHLPVLRDAAASVASRHIRNMATIGGNACLAARCWYFNQSKTWRASREPCHKTGGSVCHAISGSARCHAINSADTAPVLVALGARFVILGRGTQRLVPCGEFYKDDGARHTVISPGEMVSGISVPAAALGKPATYLRLSIRRGIDFALGSIAAFTDTASDGRPRTVLVLGSMTSAPRVLENAGRITGESGLTDSSIEQAAGAARAELGILTNLYCSAGYKRDLAQVLVRRVLREQKKKMEAAGSKRR